MGKTDVNIKSWLKNKKRFADIFNGMCFNGQQVINPEELIDIDKELDFSFYDKNGEFKFIQRLQDMAMLWNGIMLRVLLTVEDQDKVHYAMPVRNMVMNSLAYVDQMRGIWNSIPEDEKKAMMGSAEFFSRFRKDDKLYPVITLVFYRGDDWDGNMDLYDMFDLDGIRDNEAMMEVLKKYVPNYHISLFNPHDINDISVFKTDLQMLVGVIKCCKDEIKMKDYIFDHQEYFGNLDYESSMVYEQVLNVSRLIDRNVVKEGENADMCKAIQDMYNSAKQEGIEQGLDKMAQLVALLIKDNKLVDLEKASSDPAYRDSLFAEYNL